MEDEVDEEPPAPIVQKIIEKVSMEDMMRGMTN
jgi:hypothetical protein